MSTVRRSRKALLASCVILAPGMYSGVATAQTTSLGPFNAPTSCYQNPGNNELTCGAASVATGSGATAYGAGATANASLSSAFGSSSTASAVFATAVGNNAIANDSLSTAVGSFSS